MPEEQELDLEKLPALIRAANNLVCFLERSFILGDREAGSHVSGLKEALAGMSGYREPLRLFSPEWLDAARRQYEEGIDGKEIAELEEQVSIELSELGYDQGTEAEWEEAWERILAKHLEK